MNEASLKGAMFYLIHDMLIKAALFMLIGIIIYITGTSDLRKMGGLMKKYPALGWCYLIAAFGLAGIPPLSGFVGKLLIVQGGFEAGSMWSSIFILASSLLVLLSVIRIFLYAFWGGEKETQGTVDKSTYKMLFMPTALLVLITVAYGVGSEWITPFMDDAAKLLNDPSPTCRASATRRRPRSTPRSTHGSSSARRYSVASSALPAASPASDTRIRPRSRRRSTVPSPSSSRSARNGSMPVSRP